MQLILLIFVMHLILLMNRTIFGRTKQGSIVVGAYKESTPGLLFSCFNQTSEDVLLNTIWDCFLIQFTNVNSTTPINNCYLFAFFLCINSRVETLKIKLLFSPQILATYNT